MYQTIIRRLARGISMSILLSQSALASEISAEQYKMLMQELSSLKKEVSDLRQQVHHKSHHKAASKEAVTHTELVRTTTVEAPLLQQQLETQNVLLAKNQAEIAVLQEQVENAVQAGDAPQSFRIPGTDTDLRFYASLRGHVVHDTNTPPGSNYDFMFTNAIPLKGAGEGIESKHTHLSGNESRFGMIFDQQTKYGPAVGLVEGDFLGLYPDNSMVFNGVSMFRLRRAFVECGPWLVGQNQTTFYAEQDVPASLDFSVSSGLGSTRQPLLRFTHDFIEHIPGESLVGKIAIENPETEYMDENGNKRYTNRPIGISGNKTDATNTHATNRTPDLIGKIDYDIDRNGKSYFGIGTGVVGREYRLKNVAGGKTAWGTGFTFNGHWQFMPKTKLMWQWAGGKGIGRYIFDAAGQGAFYNSKTGEFKTQSADGGYVALAQNLSDTVTGTLTWGATRIRNASYLRNLSSKAAPGGVNRFMRSVQVNVMWQPVKNFHLGLGYIYSERKVEDGRRGQSDRILFQAKYDFGSSDPHNVRKNIGQHKIHN